jgi:hypothetical protein
MPLASRLRAALSKPFLPAVFFFSGVTFDSFTLTRIDSLTDNLILLLYLSLLGALIIITARANMGEGAADVSGEPGMVANAQAPAASLGLKTRSDASEAGGCDIASSWASSVLMVRAQPYYPHAIQFLLGGLYSAYTIFYFQSASLTATAVFFGVLVALLVGNEFLHDRLSNLRLLVSLYALVVLSFFTFFLPALTGLMNTWVFLIGAGLSAAVTLQVVNLIYRGRPTSSRWEPILSGLPAIGLILVLVGFYFLNWIPPVPLSMKFGGVYQKVAKADGAYRLTFEQGAWYQYWKRSDDPFRGTGPAYCFTAVFAPVDMRTTIFHRWQYRPAAGRDFSTTDRIALAIAGGREGGYRGYTIKQRVMPGDWRVDVETPEGRIIGRVSFRVEEPSGEMPEFEAITY